MIANLASWLAEIWSKGKASSRRRRSWFSFRARWTESEGFGGRLRPGGGGPETKRRGRGIWFLFHAGWPRGKWFRRVCTETRGCWFSSGVPYAICLIWDRADWTAGFLYRIFNRQLREMFFIVLEHRGKKNQRIFCHVAFNPVRHLKTNSA